MTGDCRVFKFLHRYVVGVLTLNLPVMFLLCTNLFRFVSKFVFDPSTGVRAKSSKPFKFISKFRRNNRCMSNSHNEVNKLCEICSQPNQVFFGPT